MRNGPAWALRLAWAFLLLSLAACERPSFLRPATPTPEPVPTEVPTPPAGAEPPAIQVFFTAPVFPDKPATRQPSVNAKFADFLASAQRTLDIAVFQLDLPDAVQALADAQTRGVQVRIVTDVDILKDPKESVAFRSLERGGILVVGGNANGIMHHKFAVADGARVWTGSWNFTANDTWRYNNNALWIESPDLARNYASVFEAMHAGGRFARQRKQTGAPPRVDVAGVAVESLFAPENEVQARMIALIQKAERSVDLMAYVFTDDAIGGALLERARSGIRVRGVIETIGSETRFSEYGPLKAAGLDVHQDGNPYLMHHKVIIIDGKIVITGSYNFTASAGTDNDENVLIIYDRRTADIYTREFARVLNAALQTPAIVAPDQ